MSSVPPLSVTVSTKKRACVIDVHLALSKFGLLLAQRLGEELDLWLVRELWQILDNTQHYIIHPELLIPFQSGEKGSEPADSAKGPGLDEILNQWELARIETDLAGLSIYWIGDAMRESLLPQGVDQNVILRYETLARCLDVRAQGRDWDNRREGIFSDCFRDAVALTAAPIPYRAFILTQQTRQGDGAPEDEPVICSYLREWNIPCYKVGSEDGTRMERAFLNPIFSRAGISELIWAGLNLAAVHVVLPEALIISSARREEDTFPAELSPFSDEKDAHQKDWWKGAVCFWYSLSGV